MRNMSLLKKLSPLCAAVLLLSSCVPPPPEPTLTPLEIQSLQSREFETNKDIAFASVISVFQDLGYIITSADKPTGFITATSAIEDNTNAAEIFFFSRTSASQTAATAVVEPFLDRTRVRLNFVVKQEKSSYYGQSIKRDEPILKAEVYQNAFERIENAIFVRSG